MHYIVCTTGAWGSGEILFMYFWQRNSFSASLLLTFYDYLCLQFLFPAITGMYVGYKKQFGSVSDLASAQELSSECCHYMWYPGAELHLVQPRRKNTNKHKITHPVHHAHFSSNISITIHIYIYLFIYMTLFLAPRLYIFIVFVLLTPSITCSRTINLSWAHGW